jgi:hypothetical protein
MCINVYFICPACSTKKENTKHPCAACFGANAKCKGEKDIEIPLGLEELVKKENTCNKKGCYLNPKVVKRREEELAKLRQEYNGELRPEQASEPDDDLEDGCPRIAS